jgi:hypothetical protein
MGLDSFSAMTQSGVSEYTVNYCQFRTNLKKKVVRVFILNSRLRSRTDQRNFTVDYKDMLFLAES